MKSNKKKLGDLNLNILSTNKLTATKGGVAAAAATGACGTAVNCDTSGLPCVSIGACD